MPPQVCPDEVPAPEPKKKTTEEINGALTGWLRPFIQALIDNKLILFVKEVRSSTGLGLKEAKDFSEDIFRYFCFHIFADSWIVRNAEQVQKECEANRRDVIAQEERIRYLESQIEAYRDECVRLEHVKEELDEEAQEQRKYIADLVTLVDSYKRVLKDQVINTSSD